MGLFPSVLSSIFFPARCIQCHRYVADRALVCATCCQQITPVSPLWLSYAKNKRVRIDALGCYEGVLGTLVRAKNYNRRSASRYLGSCLRERYKSVIEQGDYIVPVALHWTRYAWRGFNQAHEMAYSMAKNSHVQVAPMLKRVRRTRFQAYLHKQEREKNLSGAFCVRAAWKKEIQGKHIIVVDDVCTTGSTLVSAVRVLARYKPASIRVIVAARTVSE